MEEPSKCQSWQRDLLLVEVLSPALRGVRKCRLGLQAPATWALAALSIEFAVFRPSSHLRCQLPSPKVATLFKGLINTSRLGEH